MPLDAFQQQANQLQQLFQQNRQILQQMAQRLQARVAQGDPDAREMLLDLREAAIGIQQEQQQAMTLVQQLAQELSASARPAHQPVLGSGYAAPAQAPVQNYGNGGGGGLLSGVLDTVGSAIEWGAGFAIGKDIIDDLF
jgi:hypothetical protein